MRRILAQACSDVESEDEILLVFELVHACSAVVVRVRIYDIVQLLRVYGMLCF